MEKKKVTYKEPSKYFNADMKKAAEEWEKENAGKTGKAGKTATAKKKNPAKKK